MNGLKCGFLVPHRNVCMNHVFLPLVIHELARQLVHRGRHDLQPRVGGGKRPLERLDLGLEHVEARHRTRSKWRPRPRGRDLDSIPDPVLVLV